MKRKGSRAFWHNIKFKYRLTIINENTLEEVAGLRVSKLNGLSVLLSVCTVLFLAAAFIIIYTPLRNYLPGYMSMETREMVVTNALKADSLRLALEKQNLYIMNIQDIFRGVVKTDSVQSIDSLTNVRAGQLMERTVEEEEFRRKYEEKERYNLRAVAGYRTASGLMFYRPADGILERGFAAENGHFGIVVSASPKGSVMAVLDGTVIMADYTAGSGYVIQVQHAQDFVSIYRNCGSLMKRVGDRVKGGDVIALTGGNAGGRENLSLEFELWHRGNAVNPEKYVVF